MTVFLLEVHLFDFAEDVYGRAVEVDFVARIRDEHKFESFDALRRQIQRDTLRAREILGLPVEARSGAAG
jgi:riboflavin kinase/FMN adenylyltransferase